MDRPSELPGYSEIVENIFAASTLEEAIFWREAMLDRLTTGIDAAGRPGGLTPDEIRLHQDAIHHTNLALENLRFCLLNNERTTWRAAEGNWQTTAVWTKRKF